MGIIALIVSGTYLIMPPILRYNSNFRDLEYVAHALGSASNLTLTNSLEAFKQNALRYNYFEVDVIKISDGEFICLHGPAESELSLGQSLDITEIESLDSAQFKSMRKNASYTSCTLSEMLDRMASCKRRDYRLIIDLKNRSKSSSPVSLYKSISHSRSQLTDRIVLQLYSLSDYNEWRSMDDRPDIVITLYDLSPYEGSRLLWRVKRERSLLWVTMYLPYVLREAGITAILQGQNIFVNTVNSPTIARLLAVAGVKGIYTDFLWSGDTAWKKC